MGQLIAVKNLTVEFSEGEKQTAVISNISFSIQSGEAVGLVGESGSGKSLTGLSLMGLLPRGAQVTSGEILYKGQDLLAGAKQQWNALRGAKLAMIFQEPMTSLNPVMTVISQIAEPLMIHEGLDQAQSFKRAAELLEEVGVSLGERRDVAYPHELSGGQRQRCMIAMAIACKPDLLIADEPTTALDVTVQKQILEMLTQLRRKYKMALLLITHDLNLVRNMTENVLVMSQGEVIEAGETSEVFSNPKNSYTRALIKNSTKAPISDEAAPSPVVVEFINVSKNFAAKSFFIRKSLSVPALDSVTLQVKKGRTLGVVGESGSGKSTLGKLLLKLIDPTHGDITFEGKSLSTYSSNELRSWRKKVQVVFQDPYSSLNPRQTLGQALVEPMKVHGLGSTTSERLVLARELMVKVGLDPAWLNRYPHEFSGGQRQRLCIARALTVRPEFLVLDEAVSALDKTVQSQILNLLAELKAQLNLTYVFISHDLGIVRSIADDLVVMKQGRIVESGSAKDIFENPREAYTRQLLTATLS